MKKSEHHNVDAVFRQHFEQTAIPLDNPELLWNKIASKQKNERKGLWFWFFGIFLFLFSLTIILNASSKSKSIIANEIIIDQSQALPNNTISENSQILPQTENEAIPSPSIPEFKSIVALSDKKENQTKFNVVETSQNVDSKNLVPQKTKINQHEEAPPNLAPPTKIKESLISGTSANIQASVSKIRRLAMLPARFDYLEYDKEIFLDIKNKDSWSKCEVKIPGHFFVDVYGLGALPMDDISLQPGNDQNAYRDLWNQKFDPVSSLHGGIQVGYQFPWGLSVSGGFEYQNIITKYEDDQSITEMITVWDPMAYFYRDVNNDIIWVGDSVTAINIYERKVVSENKYTLYNIPVQVSLELFKKPNFHVAADVSAILNLTKSYEGQFIRSDQTLIGIDSGNHDNYMKTDIGVSFEAGIRIGYYFSDNWEAYASPRFRYNPNSYLLDSEVLKITRNFAGIRAGLRYHF